MPGIKPLSNAPIREMSKTEIIKVFTAGGDKVVFKELPVDTAGLKVTQSYDEEISKIKNDIKLLEERIKNFMDMSDYGAAQTHSRILTEKKNELKQFETAKLKEDINRVEKQMHEAMERYDTGAAQSYGRILYELRNRLNELTK